MISSNRLLIRSAKIISGIFSPFHLPVLVFCMLIFFSYLSYMPWMYNLRIIALVYLFTVLIPRLSIYLYRKVNGWSRHHLSKRESRFLPYFLSILSYTTLLFLMESLKIQRFMIAVVLCAILVQGIGMIINTFFKISMHAAASGAIVGLLMAFSVMLGFNPLVALCICIFLSGVVCSARLILRVHSLGEVLVGVVIGVFCGLLSVFLI